MIKIGIKVRNPHACAMPQLLVSLNGAIPSCDEDELHLQLVSIDYDNCRSLEQSAPRVCRHCGKALIGREADACKHEQTCVLDDPRWH